MRYDPVKHALVDDDTGAVIPLAEGKCHKVLCYTYEVSG